MKLKLDANIVYMLSLVGIMVFCLLIGASRTGIQGSSLYTQTGGHGSTGATGTSAESTAGTGTGVGMKTGAEMGTGVGTVTGAKTGTGTGTGDLVAVKSTGPVTTTPLIELGDQAAAYTKDIWLDNVALTLPPSNVGTTDIVFVDANNPYQCHQKCKTSPFCRFFSYWNETGTCNLHQTLQNGEVTPENMLKYAYTVPFSQHWLSGYIRKTGEPIPTQ